ncbi:hypothetical protein FM117_04160 [Micrococcus luteus Mu201]|nr:hypothetical protein FM117_04160 [Micrococcus luteus Mu201]
MLLCEGRRRGAGWRDEGDAVAPPASGGARADGAQLVWEA